MSATVSETARSLLFSERFRPNFPASLDPCDLEISRAVRDARYKLIDAANPADCAGARIDAVYPLSVLLPGQGLNVTTMRYGDNLHVGVTTDPDLVPDPWALALGIETALGVLRDSTGRVGRADLRRMAAGA